MSRTLPRLAAVVALAVAATGCGDDDARTPTTGSSTTGSTTSSTTNLAGVACSEDDPAPGQAVESPLPADVDGDGADDDVVVTAVDDRTLAVEVSFAAGGRTVVVHDDPSVTTFAPVRVARVADVDADGDDDLWVVVGSGAAVEVVTLLVADGCDLVRPEADGVPNAFTVGASVGSISGIECADAEPDGPEPDGAAGGFFEHVGERTEGSTYEGTSTEWFVEIDPPGLRRGDTTAFSVDIETDDASRYGELTCR